MTKKTLFYFDTEFTGLKQKTTLISIGIVAEDGRNFYAEFTDYDVTQVDPWIEKHVIDNLVFNGNDAMFYTFDHQEDGRPRETFVKGTKQVIAEEIEKWMKPYGEAQMWSDCLSYDWVLFEDLWGGAFSRPSFISYIPMDICTLFHMAGIDPDISRELFIGDSIDGAKHNALYDAKVIKACHEKLVSGFYTVLKDEELDQFKEKE